MSQLFIDGKWESAEDGQTRAVINPFDGSELAQVAEAAEADSRRAIEAARRAFDHGTWPRTPAAERGALLDRVADLLLRDKETLAHSETLDTGKTLGESRADVDDVIRVFRYYAALADKNPGRIVDTGSPTALSRIVYEPVGVCGLITPWNYPLLQASWKLAPALAAGNTMVIKPSELTPLTTIALVGLLAEAGVPEGVVNLVLGAGPVAGAPLADSPLVDLVSFTGGLVTGRQIMIAAAGNVKKVALELGGKNPNIVFADADLETAVDQALNAVFLHGGQVCSAGARLLVQDTVYDGFVDAVAERADRIRLGSGLVEGTESGPLISAAHREKIEGYVASALEEGARLLAGGRRPADPELADGFFYRPTVFADCRRSMRVVREETFGPILTAECFHTEREAVELGNDTDYGLAGAVWTSDGDRAQRVAAALRHGTVWINDYHPYLPQAEWGGFKQSGIGRELGPAGLDEYREAKHVYQNTDPRPLGLFAG
ncbi:aldehyde dehydrogenase family protein [Kutzneria viridogrisea]|uniref:Betaine-aldehyde dehydrogenase n=1 Tax=Kutzneria viridogrisea TaxID=47990 RepID=A0ABR6BMY4_9PSEU|nr:betaine-aldehyde dehydrogenase [Kutzneria viridogrisea]